RAVMKLRSMLFVPADSERKLAKALDSAADALILDLEDAVVAARKPAARTAAAAFISSHAAQLSARLFVRINALDSEWALDDLAAAIGAVSNREEDGSLSPLYVLANSLCLCAAAAAGVPAIDTLHADFRDATGLAASCRIARRRGFRGKIAIHPDQVGPINE